jgi:hypothetical protein
MLLALQPEYLKMMSVLAKNMNSNSNWTIVIAADFDQPD